MSGNIGVGLKVQVLRHRRELGDLHKQLTGSPTHPVVRRTSAFAVSPAGQTVIASVQAAMRALDCALEALEGQ